MDAQNDDSGVLITSFWMSGNQIPFTKEGQLFHSSTNSSEEKSTG